jgi:hypothetical protein
VIRYLAREWRLLRRMIPAHLGPDCKEHQVEAGDDVSKKHGRKTAFPGYFAMFRKYQADKIQDCPDRRGEDAQRCRRPRDMPRFEKQIKEKKRAYSEGNAADVLRGTGNTANQVQRCLDVAPTVDSSYATGPRWAVFWLARLLGQWIISVCAVTQRSMEFSL